MKRYTNPSAPGSFSGIAKFKANNKGTPALDITELDAYVTHKRAPSIFQRVKTTVPNVNSQWQADLIDITKKNLPFKYLLSVVDVFSRYAFVEPVKGKSAHLLREAFDNIFKRNRQLPQVIYSDEGNEFKGECTAMFKNRNITYLTDRSSMKAAIVERFNRTLRLKIERYITFAKTNNFIPILQELILSYNHTIHPIHKRSPSAVYNLSKTSQALIYRDFEEIDFSDLTLKEFQDHTIDFRFKLGDYVRTALDKKIFEKSTTFKRWTEDVYQIAELCPTIPPTYKVKNRDGDLTDWRYYKEELQKVKPPEPVEIIYKQIKPPSKLSQSEENSEKNAKKKKVTQPVRRSSRLSSKI